MTLGSEKLVVSESELRVVWVTVVRVGPFLRETEIINSLIDL